MYDYKSLDIINDKAKFYANELWNEDFNVLVKRNNRLSRHLGWYKYYSDDDIAGFIEIAGYVFKNRYNELTMDSILIHEMCHWYSHKHKLNNDDYSKEFRELVIQCGGSLTKQVKNIWDKHYGYCPLCDTERILYHYKEKSIYRCMKHGVKIEYRRMEEEHDTYEPSEKLISLNNKFKEYYKNNLSRSA